MASMEQPIGIGILRNGDRVFAQRREATGHLDGFLEFPGGKVEASENPREAAVREVSEETGIDLQGVAASLLHVERFDYGDRILELHFFLFDVSDPPSLGHGDWISLSKLDPADFPPANQGVLWKLRRLSTGETATPASRRRPGGCR